jgi:archaeosine-15-forming tRNA-guanine transglycosylase
MKWALKLLSDLKEVIIAALAYFFGYNRGVEDVENKVKAASLEARRKRRENVKRVMEKWKRIRSDNDVIVVGLPKEDSDNSGSDNNDE